MFQAWVLKHASKLTNTESANFYILAPKYETAFFKRFETDQSTCEAKLLTNKSLMLAFLNLWNRRNFAANEIRLEDTTVNDIKILETQQFEGFKITTITGFLTKPHLTKFMRYVLTGFPSDSLKTRLQSMNEKRLQLFIPCENARDELFDLRDDQLQDIFLKDNIKPFLDLQSLHIVFDNGERVGIVWIEKGVYYMLKLPQLYSDAAFNTKVKTPPKPKFIHVEGPITLTEWTSKKRGLHIYMFGDRHVSEMKCPPGVKPDTTLPKLIEDSLRFNSGKTIDIFLEHFYQDKKLGQRILDKNYLVNTTDHFSDCLKQIKTSCKFKNGRFHYADIRNLGVVKHALNLVQAFYDQVGGIVTDVKLFDLMLKHFLHFAETRDPSKALKETKVGKQLEAIADVNLVKMLSAHFETLLIQYRDGLETLWLSAQTSLNQSNKGHIYGIILIRRVLEWMSRWMDYYTLARIFRSYKTSKNGYSTDAARHVIIYVGNNHCDGISAFLRKLPDFAIGERSESVKGNSSFQCLKVSAKLPLFKYD